jgi:hypothetical protein
MALLGNQTPWNRLQMQQTMAPVYCGSIRETRPFRANANSTQLFYSGKCRYEDYRAPFGLAMRARWARREIPLKPVPIFPRTSQFWGAAGVSCPSQELKLPTERATFSSAFTLKARIKPASLPQSP